MNLKRFSKPVLIAAISIFGLGLVALAGSLTPPGAVGSTMNSLADLYASITGTFDSSAVVGSTTGSIIQHLKYIEQNMSTGGGGGGLVVRESGSPFVHITSLSFEAGNFNISNVASLSTIKLDWTNGPASRSATQTITGLWNFSGNVSVSSNFEVSSGYASLSNGLFIPNNGNIGIGNTSPAVKLDITGTASVSGNLSVTGYISNKGSAVNTEEFGFRASASAVGATALGRLTVASGVNSLALGLSAVASGSGGISIGQGAKAFETADIIAIGRGAIARTTQSIVLGATAETGNAAGAIAIGNGAEASSSAGTSIAIGPSAKARSSGSEQIVIGFSARSLGSNEIAIGSNAATQGGNAIAVGPNSLANANGTAFGAGASASAGGVAVGQGATTSGPNNIAIGFGAVTTTGTVNAVVVGAAATATGNNGVALGSTTIAAANSIAIGYTASATAGDFVAGGSGAGINNVYFGLGRKSTAPTTWTLNGTRGDGTDITGGGVNIAGGLGTGSGAGGSISFQTAPRGATGTTLGTLQTRMIISSRGMVGIGTVAPKNLLTIVDANIGSAATGSFAIRSSNTLGSVASISGTSLAGGSIFNITVPASTSANNPHGLMLVQNATGTVIASWSMGGRLSIAGKILSDGANSSCTGVNVGGSGCIDYAESYPTNDPTLSAGEVVAVDPNNSQHVIRASPASSVVGIISTNPAALITGTGLLSGSSTHNDAPQNTVPIALSGRVPVKITGHVSVGDHLSVSAIPGVAQTATVAGMTIGIALESSDGPTVMTFVNTGYWAPSVPLSVSSPTPDSGNIFVAIIQKFAELFHIFFTDGNIKTSHGTFDDVQLQTGVTIYDRTSGQPYCIGVENGASVTMPGECGSIGSSIHSVVATPTPDESIAPVASGSTP